MSVHRVLLAVWYLSPQGQIFHAVGPNFVRKNLPKGWHTVWSGAVGKG